MQMFVLLELTGHDSHSLFTLFSDAILLPRSSVSVSRGLLVRLLLGAAEVLLGVEQSTLFTRDIGFDACDLLLMVCSPLVMTLRIAEIRLLRRRICSTAGSVGGRMRLPSLVGRA
jgi:hypothetical protein